VFLLASMLLIGIGRDALGGSIVTAYAKDIVTGIRLVVPESNFTITSTATDSQDYAFLKSVPRSVFNSARFDPMPAA
jgi:hypothetical protein